MRPRHVSDSDAFEVPRNKTDMWQLRYAQWNVTDVLAVDNRRSFMPIITEALQSSWHVHGMRNKQPRTQEMYTRAHEPECAVQSQPCQEGNRWTEERQSIIAPWACQMPHLRLCLDLLHVLRFFVLCRCVVPVRLYTHIHCSGNVLSSINA